MKIMNSLLAPSIIIITAGIAFSFYSLTYYPYYDWPPYNPFERVLRPVVIYPERVFGVALIIAGSTFVTLIVSTQMVVSRFKRRELRQLKNLP